MVVVVVVHFRELNQGVSGSTDTAFVSLGSRSRFMDSKDHTFIKCKRNWNDLRDSGIFRPFVC